MRKTVLSLGLLIAACVLVFAGVRASVAAGSGAASEAVLLEADRAFDAATAARGEAGLASFLSDDMTTIRADQPIVRGKDAFVAGWKPIFTTPGLALRWQPQLARISDDGTLGFTVGASTTTMTEQGVSRVVGSSKYVTIWRKQPDGSWKVIFDSGVRDTPPAVTKPGNP